MTAIFFDVLKSSRNSKVNMSDDQHHQSKSEQPNAQDRVKIVSAPESIPVFNCSVLIGKSPATGRWMARVANLADIRVETDSERSALQQIVTSFKEVVAKLHAAGEPIPWVKPEASAEPHEQQRLIPVHL